MKQFSRLEKVIDDATALLNKKEVKWTRFAEASTQPLRDGSDDEEFIVDVSSKKANCFCLMGAMNKVSKGKATEIYEDVFDGTFSALADLNDNQLRSKRDALSVLDNLRVAVVLKKERTIAELKEQKALDSLKWISDII